VTVSASTETGARVGMGVSHDRGQHGQNSKSLEQHIDDNLDRSGRSLVTANGLIEVLLKWRIFDQIFNLFEPTRAVESRRQGIEDRRESMVCRVDMMSCCPIK
jgi:hypothetical protein